MYRLHVVRYSEFSEFSFQNQVGGDLNSVAYTEFFSREVFFNWMLAMMPANPEQVAGG